MKMKMNDSIDFEYVLAKESHKCCVCGEETRFIEINYEAPICSNECCKKMDEDYMRHLQECEGIDL